MESVTRLPFEDEDYECPACGRVFNLKDVESNWKCTLCDDEQITIYGEDKEGIKIIIQRKRADALIKDSDRVHITEDFKKGPHEIVEKVKIGRKIKLVLAGHGPYLASPDEIINCRIGGYC